MSWNLWNHEPKQIFPSLKLFLSDICHSSKYITHTPCLCCCYKEMASRLAWITSRPTHMQIWGQALFNIASPGSPEATWHFGNATLLHRTYATTSMSLKQVRKWVLVGSYTSPCKSLLHAHLKEGLTHLHVHLSLHCSDPPIPSSSVCLQLGGSSNLCDDCVRPVVWMCSWEAVGWWGECLCTNAKPWNPWILLCVCGG
jgi:hypothetical protein